MGMELPAAGTELLDLPDEILQICLARLPLESLSRVTQVCKRWSKLGDPHSLLRIRKALGVIETCTFLLDHEYRDGEYLGLQGRIVDNQSQKVHRTPFLGGPQRLQYATAEMEGMAFILGGRSPLVCRNYRRAWVVYSRVDAYNALTNSWCEMKPMHVARYGFAAGTFVDFNSWDLKIMVAGGYDEEGESLSSAEAYDFRTNQWEMLPNMDKVTGPCKGEMFEGEFYVQQANGGDDSIETYDSFSCRWRNFDPQQSEFRMQPSSAMRGFDIHLTLHL